MGRPMGRPLGRPNRRYPGFFTYAFLLEIAGKWYTRKPNANYEGVVLAIQEMRSFGAIASNPALEE